MNFIFNNFGKLWVLVFVTSLLLGISVLGVIVWAVVRLVTHFTATPVAAVLTNGMQYLS